MNRLVAVRRTALLTAACVLALVCGLFSTPALAYFTSGGAGTGTTASGTLQSLIILPATTGTPTVPLQPGARGDLILQVTNPNTYAVTLVRVSQGGPVSVQGGVECTSDPGWPSTLGNSGVSIPATITLNISLPGGSSQVLHLPAASAMGTSSAADCQGASFNIPVTVEAQQ
ncbi:hypothetical protein [Arthrobacter sp.]|uniref:hypothetical protein n=1 Tax=Arthrobacter sp. TaxID=1667 RepID=UPI0026DEB978|nr:hypothetical protein [Arthrobacter sp.]MDO5753420.1 hypothetical protein [Arthrobacter sp.]